MDLSNALDKPDRRDWLGYAMAGKGFILPVILLMGAGYLLDRLTGLLPGLTVLGAVIGFFIGLYLLIRLQRRLVEHQRRLRRNRRAAESPADLSED